MQECTCGYCAQCCERKWQQNKAEFEQRYAESEAEFEERYAKKYHDYGLLTPSEEIDRRANK